MNIQITDQSGNEIFKMAFNFEVDANFVSKLIKLATKHKIKETKHGKTA